MSGLGPDSSGRPASTARAEFGGLSLEANAVSQCVECTLVLSRSEVPCTRRPEENCTGRARCTSGARARGLMLLLVLVLMLVVCL